MNTSSGKTGKFRPPLLLPMSQIKPHFSLAADTSMLVVPLRVGSKGPRSPTGSTSPLLLIGGSSEHLQGFLFNQNSIRQAASRCRVHEIECMISRSSYGIDQVWNVPVRTARQTLMEVSRKA